MVVATLCSNTSERRTIYCMHEHPRITRWRECPGNHQSSGVARGPVYFAVTLLRLTKPNTLLINVWAGLSNPHRNFCSHR